MFDSHTHFNIPPLLDDPALYYWRAKEVGCTHLMQVGADVVTSEIAAKMTTVFEMCFAAVGIHPDEAVSDDGETQSQMEKIAHLLSYPKVLAIGETGLDYYGKADHDAQKKLFLLHIKLAKEKKLPLIIHCRNTRLSGEESSDNAYDDLLDILESQQEVPSFILQSEKGSPE